MLGVAKLGALSHDRNGQCLGHMPQELYSREMKNTYLFVTTQTYRACSGSTYIKIGTIQRRLAWPLRKDDTQIREAFQISFNYLNLESKHQPNGLLLSHNQLAKSL